jgi:hypothetical protein
VKPYEEQVDSRGSYQPFQGTTPLGNGFSIAESLTAAIHVKLCFFASQQLRFIVSLQPISSLLGWWYGFRIILAVNHFRDSIF